MGTLRQADGADVRGLTAAFSVGRSPRADLTIEDGRVSWEHARVQWTGERWEVRDLGSSNGTTVDGRALERGASAPLAEGSVLAFGHAERSWILADASAPEPSAQADDGTVVRAEDGFLALPDAYAPSAYLYRTPAGTWTMEAGDVERTVAHGETIAVDGRSWRLDLAGRHASTWQDGAPRTLSDATLQFAHSADEEYVELAATWDDGHRLELGSSVHWYMLLVLARRRLEEQGLAGAEAGWMYRDELCSALGLMDAKLNVDVFRARKLIAKHGVEGAAGVIERRRPTTQVRMGIGRLEVRRL